MEAAAVKVFGEKADTGRKALELVVHNILQEAREFEQQISQGFEGLRREFEIDTTIHCDDKRL